MAKPSPHRRTRRWLKALGALAVAVLGLAAALPWILGTTLVHPRLLADVNRAFAPGRVDFTQAHFSWTGATRLDKFSLYDPKGVQVAHGPTASLDRNLWQLITDPHGAVTLSLDAAALDVRRDESGSIDLAESLRTVVSRPDPARNLTIRIEAGTLRYRDPFLAEPVTADQLDLTLRIPTAPNRVSWNLKLAKGDQGLEIQGDFDRWLSQGGTADAPAIRVAAQARRFGFVAQGGGIDAVGALDGGLEFARTLGRWKLSGDAGLFGLQARGEPLRGDLLAVDQATLGWDLAQGAEGWSIRRLSLDSPLAKLRAEGVLAASGRQRIEGSVDLAAVARQLPHALRLVDGLTVERGQARLSIDARAKPGGNQYDVEAVVSDLIAHNSGRALTLREPATLSAVVVAEPRESRVERLALRTSFLDLSASGKLEEGVNLAGTVDLAGMRAQLRDWVDLEGFDLAGRLVISGNYRATERSFGTSFRSDFHDLELARAGSFPLGDGTVEATATGTSDDTGLPTGWKTASATMRSGDASAQLDGERVDGSIRLRGSAQTRLAIAGRPGLAQLSLAGSWGEQARTLLLDRVGLRVAPVDGEASGALETVATGRLDWDAGELRLLPVATDVPPVLAIDGQGIRVSGIGRGSAATRLEGGVGGDLATADALISKWSGRPALGLVGHWSAIASATGEADGLELAARLKLDEPSPSPEKKPTSLAIRAHYLAKPDRLDLAELTATTPYGTLDAAGSIHGPFADRTIDLHGNLAPDFAAITAFLGRTVEPRASLEGKPRAFRASGSLDPSGKGLEAEAGFEIVAADVYGLKLGPTPIVIRAKQGKYSVDPIATTLNSGHIRLEPEIDLEARDGPVLRLAKNSAIRDAAINDAVSRRFLAFVAPVLEQATTASGFVSVDLDHAEFPLGGGEGRHAKVEGAVVFEDVEFAPGPLASDLLGVIGRREARLKLDQPVTLTIADGRVNQRGLAIPVGDLTRIELAGWVDFDRNLSLNATLPVTPAMLGNNEILSDIAAGTRVKLPIRGTLDHPRIDREALAENLKETARSLLTRGATRGALELLMRMSRPRDPDAPPPPTAEERREKRLEKKAERKAKRQGPPPQDPQPGPGER